MAVATTRSGVVTRRQALLQQLEAAAGCPVTLIAAPAGSGKTVLVRSWLDARTPASRAAWVSVDRGERDGQRFWGAIVAELGSAAPDEVTVEQLFPTPRHDGAAVVERLRSNLAALSTPLVLVIDDVHEIVAPEILDQLTYLLDHLPSHLRVVLITRRDPRLGLHRLRVAGELAEVRSADLRFTLEESRDLLTSAGVELSDESLGLLHDRTEGWVAGLRLAALSLANHADPEGFVAEFSGSERTVAEYLLAEVLDSQPPDVRRLLVRCSVLDRVNGELGDLLAERPGTERDLRELADTGGFVVALDSQRTWFRFHHLFADLLKLDLRQTESDAIPGLHRAAATWLAEHGHTIEAVSHFQAAGDRDQVAGLLIEHYGSLALDGRQATAHAMLETFAADPAAADPEIATVLAADQLFEGSLDKADAYVALATHDAELVPAERRYRFDTTLLVVRLALARRRGDFRSVSEEVQSPHASREPRSRQDISLKSDAHALTLMHLGIVEVWSRRLDDGTRHLEQAIALAQQIDRPYIEVGCRAHLGQALTWRSFAQAHDACREAIAVAERHGWGTDPVIGPALVTLAVCLLQGGRLEEAEQWLVRAEQTLHAEREPAVGYLLHGARGALSLARGDYAATIASFKDAERLGLVLVEGSPLSLELRRAAHRARIGLGDLAAVRAELATMSVSDRATGEMREIDASLALAKGDPRTALDALQPTLSGEADVHHPLVIVRSLILEALARDELGETAAAEEAIERALGIAEPDALILPFLHSDSQALLQRHPHHRTAHGAFLGELLDVFSGHTLPPATGPPRPAREALTETELRVLRLLPTNLPAADIAREIYVSTNTVKTHMRHIYAKLQAHSRAEAVARGRELGLLGRSNRGG